MKTLRILVLLPLILFSCKDDSENTQEAFDRTALLQQELDQLILPAYAEMNEESATLESMAADFAAAPDEAGLEALRSQWLATAKAWKHAEFFNFGPIEYLGLETSVDYWPTDTYGIENAIAGDKTIDQALLNSLASNRKGIPAIEYLLFNGSTAEVLAALQESPRRMAYLQELTANLHQLVVYVESFWDPNGKNHAATFLEASGNTAGASITLLSNELIFVLSGMKNDKLGRPLGHISGTANPDLVESPYADASLPLLAENLSQLRRIFTGADSAGFDDYLNALPLGDREQSIAEDILDQLDVCDASLAAIDGSLQDAISTSPDKVETLYAELSTLNVLIKSEMMSGLGLIVTFSDGDGD